MNVENLSVELVRHLGDAGVRAVAIALPAALVTLLLRRRAASCHGVWTAVVVGMLALPLLQPVAPPAKVQVGSLPVLARLAENAPPIQAPYTRRQAAIPLAPPVARTHSWQFYAAVIYFCGFFALTARLLAGVLFTRRLVRRATPLHLDASVAVFESSQVRIPVTGGFLRPRILLPADWHKWDEATRIAVLAHEGAHVQRRDGLINLIAAINTSVFWFHPLAWWLERRLAVLAEHAADDVAMEACGDAQQYATILLEIAASCNGREHRLIWGSVSMEGGRIGARIRRALSPGHRSARLNRLGAALIWSGAAVVVWFAGALQFQSTARAQQGGPPIPEAMRLTHAQAAELERQHAANPDDERTTQRLLGYYWFHRREQERAKIIFWMIDHHPEWQLNRLMFGSLFGLRPDDDRVKWQANYDETKKRWKAQVEQHPDDPRVLGNAALALGDGESATAISLLERAQKLDPANWTESLARYYSWTAVCCNARTRPGLVRLASQVRASLEASTDSALILATVQQLLQGAGQATLGARGSEVDLELVRSTAKTLLDRVEQLQPGSQAVLELREGVRQLGTTLLPAQSGAGARADNPISPRFDTASVKIAGASDGVPIGGPGTPFPDRIHYSRISLKELLKLSFQSYFEVHGPAWLDSEYVQVDATMPPATTEAQFQEMLGNLVQDKFKLAYHTERTAVAGYVLTGPGMGPRMKESGEAPVEVAANGLPRMVMPFENVRRFDDDGFPPVDRQRAGPDQIFLAEQGKRAKIIFRERTMQDLARTLGFLLNAPVVDATGLKSKYDFTMVFAGDLAQGGSTPRLGAALPDPPGAVDPDLFEALRSQLGLNLVSRKVTVAVMVVDHLDKMPG